jgi:hypothetical protein
VQTTGTLATALTVTLASADTAHLTVPPTVTIPAGASSATFTITAPNNNLTEGTLLVTLSANAPGFNGDSGDVAVPDNDVHHFTIGSIGTQVRGVPFSVTVTARDLNNLAVTGYTGAPALTATGGVPITPATAGPFVNGVWTGSVTANAFGTGILLSVNDGAGHTGVSNSFNIGVGPVDRFAWSPVPTPQTTLVPFNTTVTALDAGNNTVTTFTGTANLSGFTGTGSGATVLITEAQPNNADEIEFTNVSAGPVSIAGWTVHIYDEATFPVPLAAFTIPAGTTVAAGQVFRLQEGGTAPGTFPLFFYGTNINWNPGATAIAVLLRDAAGNPIDFMCVGDATPASITSPIPIPASQWTGATVAATASTTQDYSRTGNSDANTAANWSVATPTLGTVNPGLTLPFPPGTAPVTISPTVTGAFVGGVWTGAISVHQAATQMRLRAADASSHTGDSNPFNVIAGATLAVTPAGGFASSGNSGGPFAPASTSYFVSNSGGNTMTWTVSKTAPWLTLSTAGGTLAPGANAAVTVRIDPIANGFVPGVFTDTLTFANTTNGAGNTTRPVALTVLAHPVLSVSPAGGFSSLGAPGGPFSPASAAYTVANTGTAPLAWTAASTAPWLTLSATSGTLSPGANTTVTVSLNAAADSLAIGAYSDTVTFTNTNDGAGNTTRAAALNVALPAPVLAAEPPFTGGLGNTVSWSSVAGANAYEVQRATAADFSDAVSSGPVPGPSLGFLALPDGVRQHYRVRGLQTPASPDGEWTQTTQAEFNTGMPSDVTAIASGSVTLSATGGAPLAGRITNPSFEGASLSGWTQQASTGLAVRSTNTAGFAPMPTAGTYYCGFNTAHNTARTAGEFVRLTQNVDLTGAGVLLFDALLDAPPGSMWSGSVRAEVRIDGVTVWSATSETQYVNQSVDVTSYTGTHAIELRLAVVTSGTFNAQWVYFDNVRLASTAYTAFGSLTSPIIAPAPWQRWKTLTFTADRPANTALTVDVLTPAGALLAGDVPTGAVLNAHPAIASQPAIRVRANLSTSDAANTPRLDGWTVAYRALPDLLGLWSNVEASTQDATPPVIVVRNAATANTGVTGTFTDVSGLASLTINGSPATIGANGTFAASAALTAGPNVVSLAATDNAVPPNSTIGNASVFLATTAGDTDADGLPDIWEVENGLHMFSSAGDQGALGDLDRDSICNLLELALGLRADVPDPAGLPTVEIALNPADNQPYFQFHHRRLLAPGSLTYAIELSTDLQTWTPATAADIEAAAPPSSVNALTEMVHLRLKPSLTTPGHTARHIRLRVSAP